VHMSNDEPSLRELLDDPIAQLLMASDRLQVEDLIFHLTAVRRRLGAIGRFGGCGRQG
jgi:hypothetical protein